MSDRACDSSTAERHPWLILTRTFSLATAVHVMILATVGALVTTVGWRIAEQFLPADFAAKHPAMVHDVAYFSAWPGARVEPRRPLDGSPLFPHLWQATGFPPDDPIRAIPNRMTIPILRYLELSAFGPSIIYYLVGFVWTLLVWSFFGTAICRMAALKFTRDERVELRDAIVFARKRMRSCLGAYILPMIGIASLALPTAVLGLVLRWDPGVILAGLLWIFIVTFSFMMVLLLLGLLFGWPLMWAAVATEQTDAFDAVSRGYAYTYQKPFRYVAYAFVCAMCGVMGWLVIWGISEGMIGLAWWAASLGAGRDRMLEIQRMATEGQTGSMLLRIGSELIVFWNVLIRTFASGFAFSFFFTAAVGIYLLLRRDVDATELDTVSVDAIEMDDSPLPSAPSAKAHPGEAGLARPHASNGGDATGACPAESVSEPGNHDSV